MRWFNEETEREMLFLQFRQELRNTRPGTERARNERTQTGTEIFLPLPLFVQKKGTDCSPSKNSDGRHKCRGCDLSLVPHLSSSWEEAEASQSHLSWNFPKCESSVSDGLQLMARSQFHVFTSWRRRVNGDRGGDRRGGIKPHKIQRRSAHQNMPSVWGIPRSKAARPWN